MILKALYDYYQRYTDYDSDSLPRYGTMNALISFIVVIDINGKFIRLEDCRQENGKGKTFVLPLGVHTNAITPFLFWDNCQYALDYSTANKPLNEIELKNPQKVQKWEKSLSSAHSKHKAFVEKCIRIANETQEEKLQAVASFYRNGQLAKLMSTDDWELIKKNPSSNVSFRISGDTQLVANIPVLLNYIEKDSDKEGICLITGKRGAIIRKSTPTPISGCNASASLVSFQEDSGYDSYGKSKAYNAPISIDAEFAFSTALKKLNEANSKNKFSIGNRLYVYFASKNGEVSNQMVNCLFDIFGKSDDPNSNLKKVRDTIKSIYNGKRHKISNNIFHIIGIAPNLGREAIIYYSETELSDFAGILDKHFADMEVYAPKFEKSYYGLYEMLRSVTLKGDVKKNCPPNLPDAVVKSIFQGLPYPYTLFAAAIRRIRAEQDITPFNNPCRVAIIKAYLNRLNDNNTKIKTMLDKENTNPGYLCGRLFAVLCKIQNDANHINSIQERYMNSASATPSAVFATILNLSAHHSEKLNEGTKIFYEKIKQEIIAKLPADGFPTHLDLQEQGRFFVGFYHQRQDFFTSKKEENITE